MSEFYPEDLRHIHSHDLTPEKVKTDLDCFHNGFETLQIIKPATLNDGILKLNQADIKKYCQAYDRAEIDVTKFVPSSGPLHGCLKIYITLQILTINNNHSKII